MNSPSQEHAENVRFLSNPNQILGQSPPPSATQNFYDRCQHWCCETGIMRKQYRAAVQSGENHSLRAHDSKIQTTSTFLDFTTSENGYGHFGNSGRLNLGKTDKVL